MALIKKQETEFIVSTKWICPECGEKNSVEMLRCVCGSEHGTSFNHTPLNSGSRPADFKKYERNAKFMWKWIAIFFVVSIFAIAFQKSGNPILEGIGDLSILLTILIAYRSWRSRKAAQKLSSHKETPKESELSDIIPIEELEVKDPETKECPMCAETIKYAAKKCRFCDHIISRGNDQPV